MEIIRQYLGKQGANYSVNYWKYAFLVILLFIRQPNFYIVVCTLVSSLHKVSVEYKKNMKIMIKTAIVAKSGVFFSRNDIRSRTMLQADNFHLAL